MYDPLTQHEDDPWITSRDIQDGPGRCAPATLWRRIASEGFPASLPVGGMNYWRTSAVATWLLDQGFDRAAVEAWAASRDRSCIARKPGRPRQLQSVNANGR